MSLCMHEWLETFSDTMPADSDILPEELEKVNGDLMKAKMEKKKKVN